MSALIILGTRKGAIILDRKASTWHPRPIAHAGIPVCYAACDPRDGTLWACLDHGHWGPKLARSKDDGATWTELSSLKYPKGARYIVKYLPTSDFDPAAPAAQPEYADASVLKYGPWLLVMPISRAASMLAPSLAVYSSATMAATAGN